MRQDGGCWLHVFMSDHGIMIIIDWLKDTHISLSRFVLARQKADYVSLYKRNPAIRWSEQEVMSIVSPSPGRYGPRAIQLEYVQ